MGDFVLRNRINQLLKDSYFLFIFILGGLRNYSKVFHGTDNVFWTYGTVTCTYIFYMRHKTSQKSLTKINRSVLGFDVLLAGSLSP